MIVYVIFGILGFLWVWNFQLQLNEIIRLMTSIESHLYDLKKR